MKRRWASSASLASASVATGPLATGPLATGLVLLGMVLAAPGAQAQVGSARDGVGASMNRHTPAPAAPRPAPPPALPGAQSTGAAPSNRIPLDMPPNEALFDGINRGDIGAVRDALSRGADLRAHNILGITPTELAIDLGKNDIAFLLLSMRSADKGRGRPRPEAAPFPGTEANRRTSNARATPRPPTQQTARSVAAPARTPGQLAPQYANAPDTPVPSAGFLGFDDRQASR
ncbi:MAG: hypothetical protein AB7O80_24090 [Acetobacteraceae bacterium]